MALKQQRIDFENKNTKNLRTTQNKTALDNLDTQKAQAEVDIASEAARLAGIDAYNIEIEAFGFNTDNPPGNIADVTIISQGVAVSDTSRGQWQGKLQIKRKENLGSSFKIPKIIIKKDFMSEKASLSISTIINILIY